MSIDSNQAPIRELCYSLLVVAQSGKCPNFCYKISANKLRRLNLTAASYVHILEPLWNPMVEAQAAARVDRLDQTKDVVIIRYIVKHSIEEVHAIEKIYIFEEFEANTVFQRIQARQKKKILYAKFSTSQMSMDEMRDILDDSKVRRYLKAVMWFR